MFRIEKDALGTKKVPGKAYYGIFTVRALKNFNLTGTKCHKELIRALALIKLASAKANISLGQLDKKRGGAIVKACKEVSMGRFNGQFVLDMLQAGAGTPNNMNANEVIANRALEISGRKKGDYSFIHPNDHVNMGQSSNDVVPTAVRLAVLFLLEGAFKELQLLGFSFGKKEKEFKNITKVGRTHFQDAVPIKLGQEFGAYKEAVLRGAKRIQNKVSGLLEIGLGGTAIGTGLNAHPRFARLAVKNLARLTGNKFKESKKKIYLTQSMSAFTELAGEFYNLASEFIKISNDLMLLSSGPLAGMNEINLPEREPGSSIMPGKVNPSIVEAFKMACMQIQGNSLTVMKAGEEGNLELNVQTPLIAYDLFSLIELLHNACKMFRKLCVDGINANKKRIKELFNSSLCTATAFAPKLGYAKVAEIVKKELKRRYYEK